MISESDERWALGSDTREQKDALESHPPRVAYHQVYYVYEDKISWVVVQSYMETLMMNKPGSMKFTTQNDLY